MSAFSSARRAEVTARAGQRCEYCHLPTRGQVATFPIDHIIPRAADGTNDLDNLALTCPHCNAHKWVALEAMDPDTGEAVRLYHPRRDDWDEHFGWAPDETGVLMGKSAVGRATVTSLRINDPGMNQLRLLLAELGLFTEARG
jgi:hypothetical protein